MNIQELAKKADDEADQLINMPGEYHPDWHDVRDSIFADLVLEEAARVCDAGTYKGYVPVEDGSAAAYYDCACQDCADDIRALKGAK